MFTLMPIFHTTFRYILQTRLKCSEIGSKSCEIWCDITVDFVMLWAVGVNIMKKGIEAFTILYLTLCKLYIEQFFTTDEVLKKQLNDAVQNIGLYDVNQDGLKTMLANSKESVLTLFDEVGFAEKLDAFDNSLGNQATFYRYWITMFECLLSFLRCTKQRCWELHLSSLHLLTKYFFAHDQQSYARMVPVYLAEMYALKEKDPEVWQFLSEGNFSINKTDVPFCAIGADHGIEHENRAMKVMGGIRGLTDNAEAL